MHAPDNVLCVHSRKMQVSISFREGGYGTLLSGYIDRRSQRYGMIFVWNWARLAGFAVIMILRHRQPPINALTLDKRWSQYIVARLIHV